MVEDITDRVQSRKKLEDFSKKLERQVDERTQQLGKSNHKLQDTVKRLKSTNAELESFAYIASHDLKEPLRKIQMFMERVVAYDSDNISSKSKQYIGRIDNAIDRMRTLIDELLAYSRTGSENFRFEDTDLRSTLESVIENLSGKIEESNAQIDYDQLGVVSAIPFQLKQVFQNLLENSLKFVGENTTPKIKVTSYVAKGENLKVQGYVAADQYLVVSFEDNGIGFDQENGEKIFEIFQRLHGKLEYQGTGIGLAIVKKIIENHKGFIEAKSDKDRGATFILYLPVKRVADK